MKMPFLLISPKIVPKIQLIKKGGCFEYHAVIADKIKYRYVHRASICPALGMDRRSFFMPKPMGKYKRLEVFHLSKSVYTVDKPSDCHLYGTPEEKKALVAEQRKESCKQKSIAEKKKVPQNLRD